ncbi:MAG: hypothetical protein QGH76_01395 [Phycisphaerales bacterium]|nr:hypothetical protein [Phycisphaerales bacterium]
MKTITALTVVLVGGLTAGASADIIAYQSFEFDGLGGKYYDTGDAAVDHQLFNNAGEAWVEYNGGDGSMAFTAWYWNTRNGSGLVDGDYVGVTNYTGGGVGAYTDGTQGYQLSDTDGMMSVDFGSVDFGGATDVMMSVDIFVASTGWEDDDSFFIMTSGGAFDTLGTDIDDSGLEGVWTTIEFDLSGLDGSSLVIGLDSNSGTEAIYIDNIVFSSGGIPAPGALALLGLAGLAPRRRR